jgi:hypothetical protein
MYVNIHRFVQSFFAGYEPLRKAFGLENVPIEDDEIDGGVEIDIKSLIKNIFTHDLVVDSYNQNDCRSDRNNNVICNVDHNDNDGDNMIDIDEATGDDPDESLPPPPAHLTGENLCMFIMYSHSFVL